MRTTIRSALVIACALCAFDQTFGAAVISNFNPTMGAPGDQVQLYGTGFSSGTLTIRFWNNGSGAVAKIVAVNSDTVVTVTVPSGISTGPISVQQSPNSPSYSVQDFSVISSGPFITGFFPDFGDVGETVNVTGLHFTNVKSVLFHGTSATEFTPNAAGNQITTRVPTGATSGPITITTGAGTSNSPASFTVVGAGPFITDFFPVSGMAGTQVQIRGMHFTGTSRVTFNGVAGVNLSANSDVLITVQAPTGVTTGPIGVYTAKGSAVTSSNFYARPAITGFTPSSGAPGDRIQLFGNGFASGNITIRFWNGGSGVLANNVYINSDNLITLTVPSGIKTGPISVQRANSSPAYTEQDFNVIWTGPLIGGFLPSFGEVGDTINITGLHFTSVKKVLFNGTSATDFWPNADGSQITTHVPRGATTGPITVSTTAGTTNSSSSFTVVGPTPFITDFAPRSGDTGTKVQISGMHFTGANRVTFNGVAGVNLAANSDVLLQIEAPANVTTGPITVYTSQGSGSSSSNFYAKPAITSLSPASGRSGTNVLIVGRSFTGTTAVQFNSQPCTNFTIVDNANIRAVAPVGAASGPVRVIAPGGSAFSSVNFVVRPTITSFTPSFGPAGTPVVISGANLNAGTPSVRFNGVLAAPPTSVSFGQLTVLVPSGASTGPLSVTTTDGSDTNANPFYLPAMIESLSPNNSPLGSRVSIKGQNFLGASRVTFNGTAATSFFVTNNNSMSATVPSGVISGPLEVTTPAGSASSASLFYGSPTITDFSPTHGLPGASVKINGQNFLGGTVLFGNLSAAIVSLDNNHITATVPDNAQTGPLTVRGPAGTNTSTAKFVLDYASDLRVSISSSANPVVLGSNLVYTISLQNAGPSAALNAVFTNHLPANASLCSACVSEPWLLTTNRNMLIGTTTNFSLNSSHVLTVVVVPQNVGTITNTIILQSDNPDPKSNDNSVTLLTTVEPLALLSIGRLADRVQLSWPVALSNFALEYQDQLATKPHWGPVATPPVISGNLNSVTESTNGSARFYRLHR